MQLVKLTIYFLILISLDFQEHSVKAFGAKINSLRINVAVTDLNVMSEGVSIYTEDELLFLTVNDELTYQPGTANLTQPGKKVLASVAELLSAFPELKLAVVLPPDIADNRLDGDDWTLRGQRVEQLIRILRDDYKLKGSRLNWLISKPLAKSATI